MVLSQQAQKNKPKKPLNAYFKFRFQKLSEMPKNAQKKNDSVKQQWEKIDPKIKEKMDAEYKQETEQYKQDLQKWKAKYNVQEEDVKRKSKKAKNTDDEQDKKPMKTKGTKETKEEKKKTEEKKKAEEKREQSKSVEKERGKSKKEEKQGTKKGGKTGKK